MFLGRGTGVFGGGRGGWKGWGLGLMLNRKDKGNEGSRWFWILSGVEDSSIIGDAG